MAGVGTLFFPTLALILLLERCSNTCQCCRWHTVRTHVCLQAEAILGRNTHRVQPEVRLRCGREAWHEHAHQHTAREGAGYQAQAHLGEPERRQAQRHRSSHRWRAHLVVSRPLGDAAAASPSCTPSPARKPWPIHEWIETIPRPHCARCMVSSLQP